MYDLSIPGWMSEEELQLIESIASTVPENGVIVELGSYKGRSAVAWAKSCHPSVKVYCVDLFATLDLSEPDWFDEFKMYTKDCPNIIPVRGICPVLLDYPGDAIDVFFNDGFHYNPYDWNNINYFRKFIKPNGLLMGHDYNNPEEYPDIIDNVRRLETELSQEVTAYHHTCIYSFRM